MSLRELCDMNRVLCPTLVGTYYFSIIGSQGYGFGPHPDVRGHLVYHLPLPGRPRVRDPRGHGVSRPLLRADVRSSFLDRVGGCRRSNFTE